MTPRVQEGVVLEERGLTMKEEEKILSGMDKM